MKRTAIILFSLTVIVGCEKEIIFNISDYWWTGKTKGGNTQMYIRFISDTEFEFEDEGKDDRASFLRGKGKYVRNGNDITFNFSTQTISLTPSHIVFLTGEWSNYPTEETQVYKSSLKLKYTYWINIGEVETPHEECISNLKLGYRE